MKANRQKILRLLKTVRGQIDGLIKMVEEDRYCIEISNQISASRSILKKINLEILKGHFNHCVRESFEKDDKEHCDKKIDEVLVVLDKLLN